MTPNWTGPFTFSEWFKRTLSFFNLVILIFSLVGLSSEFRFDWGEKLLGAYLLSTNAARPERGTVWETGRSNITARQHLNEMISHRENTRQTVREADSFAALASRLGPGEWVTLDQGSFKKFYRSLSASLAGQLIDPVRLVWLLKGGGADRIFCEGRADRILIYFIDTQNRVVHQVDLLRKFLATLGKNQAIMGSMLEDFKEFSGRIYPADVFFAAAVQLPRRMIRDLIPSPMELLNQKGVIQRVGIWNQEEGGAIRLGFEMTVQGENRVVMTRAREWAVWQLGLILKGEQG